MKNEEKSNPNTNKNNNLDKETDAYDSNIKKDFNFILKDLAFFKNDILKELKNLEFKIDSQKKLNTDLRSKISNQDSQLSKIRDTLENVTSLVNDTEATTNYYKEKINKLMDFKRKSEDNYSSLDYKLRSNTEELKDAIDKYDKVIYEFLKNPSFLGREIKFKNLPELFDYVLNNIKILSVFKDKSEFDLKSYKVKLDTMIQSINLKISGIMENANSFTINTVTQVEKKCMDEIKNLDEKVMKIRVANFELTNQFEKVKKEIFEESENMKKSNKEMSELLDLSLEKINNNNINMQKTINNYENKLNEIKENITSLNELYNKFKKENNEEKHDNKNNNSNNNTKSDYFNNPSQFFEKSREMKRIQSAKTLLQKYIEGNTFYDELIESHNQKCLKHENSESSVEFMMKKYYDEGYDNIKDINIIESIRDKNNKNNPLNERVRMNKTMNPSEINKDNSNHFKNKDEQLNENEIKNSKRAHNKLKNDSKNNKIRLIKNVIYNNKRSKSKSKEDYKKIVQPEFSENFLNKSRLAKLEVLSNISLLYDYEEHNQFPKIESDEVHKNDELFLKAGKNDKNFKNKMDQLKPKEINIIPIIKNKNINKQKTKKIKNRLNSSAIIRHNNIKESNKNISAHNIHGNKQEMFQEKDKRLINFLNKRKSNENIKKSELKPKFKKNQ